MPPISTIYNCFKTPNIHLGTHKEILSGFVHCMDHFGAVLAIV
jgi:hypothetical protein